MRVMVPHKTSEEQDMMFIFIYLYNVYQTKTDTASNLKRIEREQKKKERGEGEGEGRSWGVKTEQIHRLADQYDVKNQQGRRLLGAPQVSVPSHPSRQAASGGGGVVGMGEGGQGSVQGGDETV